MLTNAVALVRERTMPTDRIVKSADRYVNDVTLSFGTAT
jgi:hypothetical protein